MSQTFSPHPLYRWLTLGCLLLTGLLGWSLVTVITAEEFFFFILSATICLWFGNSFLSQVHVDEKTVEVRSPLHGVQRVEFRQLVSVTETGRFIQALSLLYYPRQTNGLLDLDHIQHLLLPAVVDQATLLTAMEARIPQ
jgi:hypothetical protein